MDRDAQGCRAARMLKRGRHWNRRIWVAREIKRKRFFRLQKIYHNSLPLAIFFSDSLDLPKLHRLFPRTQRFCFLMETNKKHEIVVEERGRNGAMKPNENERRRKRGKGRGRGKIWQVQEIRNGSKNLDYSNWIICRFEIKRAEYSEILKFNEKCSFLRTAAGKKVSPTSATRWRI